MDVLGRVNSPQTIEAATTAIRRRLLAGSPTIREPNFTAIGSGDLALAFDLYDERFFDGWLRHRLEAVETPLTFRVSSRMTRSGGKTSLYRARDGRAVRFEIAVAGRLLFMTFSDIQRPVEICGLACGDRVDALQRLMEHEIIHLTELLAWGRSSCAGRRFKALAANLFGHAGTTHGLVTSPEHAAVHHGVKAGDRVAFDYQGQCRVGRVNRIGRRATVLVPDRHGQRYSDGGVYAKFYVPLPLLRVVGDA